MSSILVVEPEHRSSERIHAALGVGGWTIRVVGGPGEAQQVAAVERPDLILVSASVPAAEAVAGALSRSAGRPGLVLASPFTDQELREVVQRNLPAAAPAPAAPGGVMLTSHDIFGDVLAEFEADSPEPPVPPPPPSVPAPRPAAPPRPASPFDDDEINRKLERTLSGVMSLGLEPKRPPAPAPPATPRRPELPADSDIDALLSKTLSNLELGARPQPAAPPPRPAVPPPAPPETAAVRKAPKPLGDLDFSALDELARPRRPAAPVPPAPPATTMAVPIPVLPASPPPAPSITPPAPPAPTPAPIPEPEMLADPLPDLSDIFAEPVLEAIPELPDFPELPPLPPQPSGPVRNVVQDIADIAGIADIAATQRIQIPPMSVLSGLGEESGDQPGERFGQYTLLEKIAAGGMAEVWKARMRGVEGFQKTVAIKKILPHMTDNSEFVGMFIDEAKLAAQLSHPNIVHIYDLGKIGRDYYIAMEYVEGKDLRSLMNAGRRRGIRLPLPLALFVAARLASALDYAHRKRDFEDREMGLVHRDVSPQNVLLSLEGDVKLCDFGIAKAVSKAGQTQMGALKGKLQYMSPEQAWGRPVDARSDIFSLGEVLFEMLTGERLFTGDTEMAVLEAVRQGQVRSTRQFDPSIPAEVDEIAARALAHDPQNRFASAGEMKQRIESVLHTLKLSPGPTDLAAYVQRVLEEEPASGDWNQLQEPAAPIAPIAPATVPEPVAQASMGVAEFTDPTYTPHTMDAGNIADIADLADAADVADADPVPGILDIPDFGDFAAVPSYESAAPFEPQPVAAVAPLGEVHVEEPARNSRKLLYIVIIALLLVAILTFFLLLRKPSPTRSPAAAPATQPAAPPAEAIPATPAPTPLETPATAVKAPGLSQEEIERMVKEEMARREASIRRSKEAELEKYKKEIARMQAEARKKKEAADAAANEGEPPPQP
jgi:serine/threonine protein kinase/CheY-like chemotaxis protein